MEVLKFQEFLKSGGFSQKQMMTLKLVRKKVKKRANSRRYQTRRRSHANPVSSMNSKERLAYLQDMLNQHKIDFEVEHLKTMKKHMFQEFIQFTNFTLEQKQVLVNVKHLLTVQKPIKKKGTKGKVDKKSQLPKKPLKHVIEAEKKTKKTCKSSMEERTRQRDILDVNFDLPRNFNEADANKTLRKLGLSITMKELEAMETDEMKEWQEGNCTDQKQMDIVNCIRKKLKDRNRKSPSVKSEPDSSKSPSSQQPKEDRIIKIVTKPDLSDLDEKLQKVGISKTAESILAMDEEEFRKFKSSRKSAKQQEILSNVRLIGNKRKTNVASTQIDLDFIENYPQVPHENLASWLRKMDIQDSLEFICGLTTEEFEDYVNSKKFTDDQAKLLKSIKIRFEKKDSINAKVHQILDEYKISISLVQLRRWDRKNFRSYTSPIHKRFTAEQKEGLEKIMAIIRPHFVKTIKQEVESDNHEDDLGHDQEASMMEVDRGNESEMDTSTLADVKPDLLVTTKSIVHLLARMERRQFDLEAVRRQVMEPGMKDTEILKRKNEIQKEAKIFKNGQEMTSFSSCLPDDHVQIKTLTNGDKTFFKNSSLYPGHSYAYRLRRPTLETDQDAGLIEIYECSGCLEMADTYKSQSARKCAMDYLKTVKVFNGKIIEGDYDGMGHICVPLELVKKRYGMA